MTAAERFGRLVNDALILMMKVGANMGLKIEEILEIVAEQCELLAQTHRAGKRPGS